MSSVVLDASAVIAFIRAEPGAQNVLPFLRGGHISAVNVAEVLYNSVLRGDTIETARAELEKLQLAVIPFTESQAASLATIHAKTLGGNMGFADRACLSLGHALGLPVLTGDREWLNYNLDIPVRLFRESERSGPPLTATKRPGPRSPKSSSTV